MNRITKAHRSIKFQTKLAAAFSILTIFISALLAFTLYLNFRAELREEFRQRLHDIAAVAALDVDADAHATLTRPDQEGNATYLRIKTVLQQHRDHVADVRFIYTWRKDPDGRLLFVVDAETDPNEMSRSWRRLRQCGTGPIGQACRPEGHRGG